jgi:hypothetical protein
MISRRTFSMGLSASLLAQPALATLPTFSAAGREKLEKMLGAGWHRRLIAVSRGDQLKPFPLGPRFEVFRQPGYGPNLVPPRFGWQQMTAMAILRLERRKSGPGKPAGTYLKESAPNLGGVRFGISLVTHPAFGYTDVLTELDRPQRAAAVIKAIGDLPTQFFTLARRGLQQ